MTLIRHFRAGWLIVVLVGWSARGQSTNPPVTFNFDDGQVPAGTSIRGNASRLGVTNAGGFNNSGCLILTRPGSGETYGQWVITNDLASGVPVNSFNISFKLYMGHGSGGNASVPNAGGNGLVFHLGPTPPSQYTGSASSWSNGLDVTFRTYHNAPNSAGINVEYNPVSGMFSPGNGTMVGTSGFLGFFQTNGPADSFAEAVDVWLALAGGILNVVCSNALVGTVVVYTNLAIAAFAPISPGLIAFTATDGAGAHEDAWIDNVSINLNSYQPTGAVVFVQQPANQVTRPNEPVTFTVSVSGAPPTYQWRSNGVPITGATAAIYTTPLATAAMDRTVYSVAVSNDAGGAISSPATLRVLPALGRTPVWSDEFNGTTIDSNKWQQLGDYSRQQGYWLRQDSYLNGQGQLVLRVMQDQATGHFGAGAVQGNYQRAFGYFEAKVRFPTQQGHWCAFWLFTMSQGSTNVIGGADGCEIDIIEWAWLTDHIQHALHWDGYGANSGSAGLQVRNLGLDDGGWHIFGLDWTPTNYMFYVDGQETWRTNAGGVSQAPEYLMLTEEIGNFGTGPDAWGTGPISNALLPDYSLVDYVRVYESSLSAPILFSPFLLGSNLGVWGTNANGTINDPFMNNATVRSRANGVISMMRFPCRSFASNQLQSIATTIRNAGLEPLAIVTAKDQTTALSQVNALKDIATWFEFGNENNYADGWSGATYAARWSNDIPVLRAAAPGAKFGGPAGSDYTASGSTYLRDFLNGIMANRNLAPDFISMHYYSAHGEIPAWSASRILSDVDSDMLPGLDRLKSDIASIIGFPINLAITEWNYDAVPENNTNTLDADSAFMDSYTFKVLDGFKSRGLWAACQYDFAAGAGGGHLDLVTTSGSAKLQYHAFIAWHTLNTNLPPVLDMPTLSNGHLTLAWTGGGTLQSATNVAGPWLDLTDTASPFTISISPTVPRQLWRVVLRR